MTFDNKIITFYTLFKRLHARWGNTPKGIHNQNLPLMNRKWFGGVMPKAYLPCYNDLIDEKKLEVILFTLNLWCSAAI